MTRPKPENDHIVQREEVVRYAMDRFNEPRAHSNLRVKRKSWGYLVSIDPIETLRGEVQLYLMGNGPILVNGRTGDITETSSSFDDTFGEFGIAHLSSPEDLDKLQQHRGIFGNVRTTEGEA